MPSASEQFAHQAHLLSCLGDFVINNKLLYSLCLVCRKFNVCFTPFLYNEVGFEDNNASKFIKPVEAFFNADGWRYTKTIEFAITTSAAKDTRHSEGEVHKLYNEGIQRLLGQMPKLRRFCWAEQPLFSTTLSTLHVKCPNLRSLAISHPRYIELYLGIGDEYDRNLGNGVFELRPLFTAQNISSFRDLTDLEIYGIHGDINRNLNEIVDVLLNSPNLRTLGLSLDHAAVTRLYPQGTESSIAQTHAFFLKLIQAYVIKGGQPLPLRKIVLGICVILWEDEPGQPSIYFPGLIDPTWLEEIHIANRTDDWCLPFGETDGVAWSTFSASVCPNLRKFSLDRLTESAAAWLRAFEPGYLRQLTIADDDIYDGSQMGIFSKVLAGSDTTRSASPTMFKIGQGVEGTTGIPSLDCPDLQALSVSRIEPITTENSLDVIYTIKKMASLRQLHLDQDCKHHSSLKSIRDYENFGHELALQAKSLKYLKLDNYAWRIWHDEKTNGETGCRLEELDKFEAKVIDCFQEPREFHVMVL